MVRSTLFLLLAPVLATAQDWAPAPRMSELPKGPPPFEYQPAKIPFYPSGKTWGKLGEPITRMQKPLPAQEARRRFVTPVGFHVEIFAADPDIRRPICMNWDERGRLWIAESVDYPNELRPRGQGRDRIVVCEDADGDGRADKFTVFADMLSIPTGFTFWSGGIVVVQAPDTLFLKDTDGDGKADERKVLFTGWDTRDTHAGPSNLVYGPDGWIYGMVGYSGFVGTVGGERHSFRTGFWRYHPDRSKLEFLRNTNNNSWGVGFSEEGILFGSTANGNPSVHMPIPNRYYEKVRGWSSSVLGTIAQDSRFYPITEKVRQVDHHGKFTAGAGHALYTARSWPKEYWNRTAFVAGPTGHLVATFQIRPQGATFVSRNSWNILAADDEWSAPIMAEVGPDGQLWVIDWYNYIVQHNPTPPGYKTGKGNAYETPLRDKTHGRIYRVVKDGAKQAKAFSLAGASPDELVAALANDNLFWRRHAQRLLLERGNKDVVPALVKLAADPQVDEIGLNVGAMHALWTLQGLGAVDGRIPEVPQAVIAGLKHRSAGVRRTAVQVLGSTGKSVGPNPISLLAESGILRDTDAQVRLAGLLALADLPPDPAAGKILVGLMQEDSLQRDPLLRDALTAAAGRHDTVFLAALGQEKFGDKKSSLTLIERIAESFARGSGEGVETVLSGMREMPVPTALAVLNGLSSGWRGQPPTQSKKLEEELVALYDRLPAEGRGRLITLARRWGSKALEQRTAKIAEDFLAQLSSEKASEESRLAAAAELIALKPKDADTPRKILGLLSPQMAPTLARGLLEAVGRSEAEEVGAEIVRLLPTLTPAVRPVGLAALLGKPKWTGMLLDGVEKGTAALSDLTLDQRQGLLGHPDRSLASRAKKLLARAGGLPSPDREKVLQEWLPLAKEKGDADAGKLVFKQHCAKCHLHSGEGAKIGPDLTGMAVHPREHLLAEILDPNRSVEGNYRQYVVTTLSGRVLTGLLASESKTAIELVDVEGKRHGLAREDIELLQATKNSLMPEGFEKQIPPKDMTNLLAFLTRRGKFFPLPLQGAANVVTTRGMFNSLDAEVERLVLSDWSPRTVSGVPFHLIDPQGTKVANAVMLHGSLGTIPPKMPRRAELPCNSPAAAIHLLSGVSGWGWPAGPKGTVVVTVRLHYADGKTEDHPLRNGEHFADYIRRVEVPGSRFAFAMRNQQMRYLAIRPERQETIARIEFVKGPDRSAPVILAVTVETPTP